MEIKELNFVEANGCWEASYVSEGASTVMLQRQSRGVVSVLGSVDGMPPVVMGVYDNPYSTGALVMVNAPAGMTVTLRSATQVERGVLSPV